jgi:hypothetical protein
MPKDAQACTNPISTTARRQVPAGFVTTPTPAEAVARLWPRASASTQWDVVAMNEILRSE